VVVAKEDIITSERARPWWQKLLAIVLYGLMLFFIGLMIYGAYHYPGSHGFRAFVSSFNCALFTFVVALRFSVVTSVCFDMKDRRYKKQYKVGPVKVGRWKQLPDIEYVSVFRQAIILPGEDSGHMFNVNVWYGHNRHFTIYHNPEVKPAYDMALYIAVRLQVYMLDVTEPGNKIWIMPQIQNETPALPPHKDMPGLKGFIDIG